MSRLRGWVVCMLALSSGWAATGSCCRVQGSSNRRPRKPTLPRCVRLVAWNRFNPACDWQGSKLHHQCCQACRLATLCLSLMDPFERFLSLTKVVKNGEWLASSRSSKKRQRSSTKVASMDFVRELGPIDCTSCHLVLCARKSTFLF